MVSIGLLSDVHAHRHDQASDVVELLAHINASPTPDLLICAGDISHRTKEVHVFLSQITLPCPKCWVPGNHDIWVIDPESSSDTADSRYVDRFSEISKSVGWHYLPASPLVLAEHQVAIVGTIGWFIGNGYSGWFEEGGGARDEALARRFADELIAQIQIVPPDHSLIVVTHHLGHSASPSYDPAQGNVWNPHVQAILEEHKKRIALVIHGHRHQRYDPARIDGFLFAAHPFGYPLQHSSVEDGYRCIELNATAPLA